MRIETSKLEGAALDWAVGIALNGNLVMNDIYGAGVLLPSAIRREVEVGRMRPSTDWSQGGPLIEILVEKHSPLEFWERDGSFFVSQEEYGVLLWAEKGASLLIAAMRAIVSSEIGDTVDIPEELLP